MSNHFAGLSLRPPLGDQRLNLCDLYVFRSPADRAKTEIILNANPSADGLHQSAICRPTIDSNGDRLTDIAISYVFSTLKDGRQTARIYLANGAEARSVEAAGMRVVSDVGVSFGPTPNAVRSKPFAFFANSRSDALILDYDGIRHLCDTKGGRNSTSPKLEGKTPWSPIARQPGGQCILNYHRASNSRVSTWRDPARVG